jgi:hypothetical protein
MQKLANWKTGKFYDNQQKLEIIYDPNLRRETKTHRINQYLAFVKLLF